MVILYTAHCVYLPKQWYAHKHTTYMLYKLAQTCKRPHAPGRNHGIPALPQVGGESTATKTQPNPLPPAPHLPAHGAEEPGDSDISKLRQTRPRILLEDDMISLLLRRQH